MVKAVSEGQMLGVTLDGDRMNYNPQSLTTSWKRYSWTFNGSASLKTFRFAGNSTQKADGCYVAQIKVEEGTQDTDWTPAPEDVEEKIQANTTSITVAQGKIEGLIKDTTITKGDVTTLKDNYTSISATVNGLNSTVASHTSSITTVKTELGKVDGKINTAKADAISTAGADATSKSNKAKTDAIAAASGDATSKANNALNSAKSYTNAQITTVNTRVSNAESSITQLNNSITNKVWQTDIDKTVSKIEIGGRNLLDDTSSEYKDLIISQWYGAIASRRHCSEYGLKAGDTITFGVDIKSTSNKPLGARIDFYSNATGDEGKTVNYSPIVIPSRGEGRSYISVTIPSGKEYIILIIVNRDTSISTSTTEKYKCAKLEKGNKPTDWSPSPEDINESILAVSKEVTTVKEKAATLETNLNGITSKVTNLESTTSTINGKVNAQETRLQSTEQKVTAKGVITTITEAINAGTNSLTTMQFILDKNGTTIKNGSLKILNNAGESVLHGDTTGNLIIRGVFEQYQGGIKSVDIRNNAVNLYDWSRDGDLVGGMIAVVGNADGRGKAMIYGDKGNPLLLGYCDENRENYYGVVVIDDTKQANGNQTVVGLYDHMAFFDYQALHFYGSDHTIPLGKITVADSNNTLNILGKQNYSSVRIGEMTTNANTYQGFAKFDITGLHVWGNISCSGSKSRMVSTKNYDGVKLNAYETAECYFGDIGEGTIGEDGLCYVYIDPLLLETINTKCTYQVFVQAYGDGKAYPIERKETFFVIKGTPGLKFGWELKAKQRGYETDRLEREKLELSEQDSGESALDYIDKEPDYDDLAIKYLKDYEKELLIDG